MPLTSVLWRRSKDAILEVKSGKVCEVGDEFIEWGNVYCCFFNICALVLHVWLLHPSFAFHHCLYYVESRTDIRNVLNYWYYFLDLSAVFIEEVIQFVHEFIPTLVNYYTLEVFKTQRLILYFSQTFGHNIVLLSLRGKVLKV